MASSTTDYFSQSKSRPAIRPRQTSNLTPGAGGAGTPGSPRTPLLGRSISGQFGSPGTPFRSEQEDFVVYELGARHFSAGFAGESRPRCILAFSPEEGLRVGDFRGFDAVHERPRKKSRKEEDWGADHELYRTDIRSLDLGLVEDKLERAARKAHADFLQLANKPLKAVLTVPSLLPTPLLEIALKVLFNHYAQPPSVMILTTPILSCVGAGLRDAVVVDLGWEETVVTAVGEYKEVFQRRSVRAGKMLTREMGRVLEKEMQNQAGVESQIDEKDVGVSFEYAEEVTRRLGWCRPRDPETPKDEEAKLVNLPHPSAGRDATKSLSIPFAHLSEPADSTLFSSGTSEPNAAKPDDHELPLPDLLYTVLLALPLDLRALCISRITFTGGLSNLPGLKHRLLQELQHIVETRGWDPICNYGHATKYHAHILKERSANIAAYQEQQQQARPPEELAKMKQEARDAIPVHARPYDEEGDSLTARAERQGRLEERDAVKGVVRGVQTLGPWAGASLMASLRVKGKWEVEREEFMRYGIREVEGIV